jgi:hypothetical protein
VQPARIKGLDDKVITKACLGEYHGVALSDSGQAFIWGATPAEQHQVYNGSSTQAIAAPLIGWPPELRAAALACGYQHTLIIGVDRSICNDGSHAVDQATMLATHKVTDAAVFSSLDIAHPGSTSTVAEQVMPTGIPDTGAAALPGLNVTVNWAAETCLAGARPPWIHECTEVPADVHELDRAWYGRHSRLAPDVVRPPPCGKS